MSNPRLSYEFFLAEKEKRLKLKIVLLEKNLKEFMDKKQEEESKMQAELIQGRNKVDEKNEEILQSRINFLQCDIDDVFPVSSKSKNNVNREVDLEILQIELEWLNEEITSKEMACDLRFSQLFVEQKEREQEIKKLKENLLQLNTKVKTESGNDFFSIIQKNKQSEAEQILPQKELPHKNEKNKYNANCIFSQSESKRLPLTPTVEKRKSPKPFKDKSSFKVFSSSRSCSPPNLTPEKKVVNTVVLK